MQATVPFYRPPSEQDSFLIRVMEGCPHNQCTFCGMYKAIPCKVLPLDEILGGIETDAAELGEKFLPLLTSVYLEGGDPMALPLHSLRLIMQHVFTFFPALKRVACYATAKSILHKSDEELRELASLGLRRVHLGLETGCDSILEKTRKGCTRVDLVQSGHKLRQAHIENDVSIMLGIGSNALSVEHAIETARVINQIEPICVRVRTFTPTEGTAMGEDYKHGRIILMTPYEVLTEFRLMVEHITANTLVMSEHWTNFIQCIAHVPHEKEALLTLIDEALQSEPHTFRPVGITSTLA